MASVSASMPSRSTQIELKVGGFCSDHKYEDAIQFIEKLDHNHTGSVCDRCFSLVYVALSMAAPRNDSYFAPNRAFKERAIELLSSVTNHHDKDLGLQHLCTSFQDQGHLNYARTTANLMSDKDKAKNYLHQIAQSELAASRRCKCTIL